MNYSRTVNKGAIKIAKENNILIIVGYSDDLFYCYGADCSLVREVEHCYPCGIDFNNETFAEFGKFSTHEAKQLDLIYTFKDGRFNFKVNEKLNFVTFDVCEYDKSCGIGIAIELPNNFINGYKIGKTEVFNTGSHCSIEFTLTHNGYFGGAEKCGGFVKIKIKDLGGACIVLNGDYVSEFTFEFRGDDERRALIDGLSGIIKELKDNIL